MYRPEGKGGEGMSMIGVCERVVSLALVGMWAGDKTRALFKKTC